MSCGTKIRFWKDLWLGDKNLQEEFPKLFSCEDRKEGAIVDHIFSWMDRSIWCICPIKSLIGSEQQMVRTLLDRMAVVQFNEGPNSLARFVGRYNFPVTSLYSSLQIPILNLVLDFLVMKVWKRKHYQKSCRLGLTILKK